MDELDRFQAEVGHWADATFPQSTIATMTAHLKREAQELLQSLEAWERNQKPVKDDVVWPTVLHEVADIILLSLHIADRKRFLLSDVLRYKFQIVQARKWGDPNEEGVTEHVCDCCEQRPCVCSGALSPEEVYSQFYEGL